MMPDLKKIHKNYEQFLIFLECLSYKVNLGANHTFYNLFYNQPLTTF